VEKRIKRLREVMVEHDLQAIIVSQPENRQYISGFTGSTGHALITLDHNWFLTDFRYLDQARKQCLGFDIVDDGKRFVEAISRLLGQGNARTVGFEQEFVTVGEFQRLQWLESRIQGLKLTPVSGVFESLRMHKDQQEAERIQHAADIADAAFAHILNYIRPGLTEREVAMELETFMRKGGATGPAFATIIASGWRSSLPHGVASDKQIANGEFVKLDFGAVYEGYCSDITRTVVIGAPSTRHIEIYQIVLAAQARALDAACEGITGGELDAVARNFIAEQGYGEEFGHSLGHGLGLAVHEDPRIAQGSEQILRPGMVITIEPGVYISGWGGVRIEDDILLVDGGKRILTHAPKNELIRL
jgi:Xaa-Pro aminopeptidase